MPNTEPLESNIANIVDRLILIKSGVKNKNRLYTQRTAGAADYSSSV